ncbi:uncharacterized protein LOC143279523 [Babylonia areolata]|uniref:uncharacterized protein LOC143279523 n=1 Tax=Babylonia areolata TaxID=304850 RepID=UPI003FCF6B7B
MATQRVVLVFTLLTMPCLLAGSPAPSQFSFNADKETAVCADRWHRFRNLCWTPVPAALTFLANDVTSGDSFCTQQGARTWHVAGHLYCVKEAVRLTDDDSQFGNLFETDGHVNKRIMGNIGY